MNGEGQKGGNEVLAPRGNCASLRGCDMRDTQREEERRRDVGLAGLIDVVTKAVQDRARALSLSFSAPLHDHFTPLYSLFISTLLFGRLSPCPPTSSAPGATTSTTSSTVSGSSTLASALLPSLRPVLLLPRPRPPTTAATFSVCSALVAQPRPLPVRIRHRSLYSQSKHFVLSF